MRNTKSARAKLALALITAGLGLAGCNTIEGAGRDLSSAGKAISETARDVKN